MKIHLAKKGYYLAPTDQDSLANIKKLSQTETYLIDIKVVRNYRFLKKYMAMINLGVENTQIVNNSTNEPISADSYRKLMQIKAGYFKMYKTQKGSYIESDSIAFDKMTEEEFNKLYTDVKMQVAKDISVTSEELELQILEQF